LDVSRILLQQRLCVSSAQEQLARHERHVVGGNDDFGQQLNP
jgi:hypothetical protein